MTFYSTFNVKFHKRFQHIGKSKSQNKKETVMYKENFNMETFTLLSNQLTKNKLNYFEKYMTSFLGKE